MKLGLGTAQFGMDYGVSNRVGQTPPDDVGMILRRALEAGVRVLDTAPAYGTAEQALGDSGLADRFDVVTKTPLLSLVNADDRADAVEISLLRSLEQLRLERVYGLLVHAVSDLTGNHGDEVAARLADLRAQGLVRHIGVSIYSAGDLRQASDMIAPDIVQLPLSVYDQRLLCEGTVERLSAAGVEIHTRSALLQGVLALAPEELPSHLAGMRGHHESYFKTIAELRLTPIEAAVGFAIGVPGPAAVIVGVNTLDQFEELMRVAPLESESFTRWALDDPQLVNPARWARS